MYHLNEQETATDFDFDLDSIDTDVFFEEVGTVKMKIDNNLTLGPVHEPKGTLSSRIRCIAHEITDSPSQVDWMERAVTHPAYSLIVEELKAAYEAGTLDSTMDTLEAIGCIVTYDRATTKLSIGLKPENVYSGFTEHTKLTDIRNKHLLDRINGVSPLDTFKEDKASVEMPRLSTCYFLTFTLSE